ncbi:MAG: hypothetical protein V4719_22485, partial [Planctomycetota bacterium]
PINPLFGMGGSTSGGQTGGGGQFNGGQQGGGGGGGQFGGGANGMGGGGGGFFDVPPAKAQPKPAAGNGQQPKPVQAQPAAAGKKITQSTLTGQAFAQVQDRGATLNSSTLKDRKKKLLNNL